MIAALLPLILQAATLPVERFGDWTVACDDRARCAALAQPPVGATDGDYPPFVLRGATPPALEIPIPTSVAAGTRLTMAVDRKVLAEIVAPGGGSGLSLPVAGTLARALARGRMLTLATADRRVIARASLAGLTAARAALAVARPLEPLPAIDQPVVTARPPRALPRKQAKALRGGEPTGCGAILPRSYRLDAQHSLVAIEPSCATATRTTSFYILPEKGDAQPAIFDTPAAAAPPDHRVAGGWNPLRRRIEVLLPPDPMLDCGTLRDFAWDGARFRLAEERVVTECRRATRQITTRRAAVTAH